MSVENNLFKLIAPAVKLVSGILLLPCPVYVDLGGVAGWIFPLTKCSFIQPVV